MDHDIETSLVDALTAPDPSGALGAARTTAPADLALAIEALYADASAGQRAILRGLLDDALARADDAGDGSDVVAVVHRLVAAHPDPDTAAFGLGVGRRLPDDLLHAVLDVLFLRGDGRDDRRRGRDAVERLTPWLGRSEHTDEAVTALSAIGDARAIVPIAERARIAVAVRAFDVLDDPAAVPHLRRWLDVVEDDGTLAESHRVAARLSGVDPSIPDGPEPLADRVRRVWDTVTPDLPSGIVDLTVAPTLATWRLFDGSGRLGLTEPDPALLADRTFTVDGVALYRVGSGCDTCQFTMERCGLPPDRAATAASDARNALADVAALTDATVTALEPLSRGLADGHGRMRLVDLPLERVDRFGASWWWRRWERRVDPVLGPFRAEEPAGRDVEDVEPHFQVADPLDLDPPSYGVVMPTRPLDRLDADAVDGYARRIAAGARPAALLYAWHDHRCVQTWHPECLLLGAILDGHHRLTAYARLGVPARAVVITRWEDRMWMTDDGYPTADELLDRFAVPRPV